MRLLPNGTPDGTFGTGGVGSAPAPDGGVTGLDLAPDGRLVAVGGSDGHSATWRFTADGHPDLTFSGDGLAVIPLGTNPHGGDVLDGIAVEPDGRIVIAGQSRPLLGNQELTLARLTANGELDRTFGGGAARTEVGERTDVAFAAARQPDGKLVVAGYAATNQPNNTDFAIVRYTADGLPDPTFGTAGRVITAFGPGAEEPHAVAVQADGKIVVAGLAVLGEDIDFALARYNPDGTPDETFDGDGRVTTHVWALDYVRDMVLQPDGKIVVAGLVWDGETITDSALVRYNPDGSLDEEFGTGGIRVIDMAAGHDDGLNALELLADGRLLAAGYTASSGTGSFAAARFTPDGLLDPTFGGGPGFVTTPFPAQCRPERPGRSAGRNIRSWRIRWCGTGSADLALVGYTADGALDSTFGESGRVSVRVAGGEWNLGSLVRDAAGNLVAVGQERVNDLLGVAVVRFTDAGALDPTFDGDGKFTTKVGPADTSVRAGLIDSTGRILAVGASPIAGYSDFAVVGLREMNVPPVPVPTAIDLPHHGPYFGTGATYVTDPEGGPLTVTLTSGPAHGTLTLQPNGDFIYTPDPFFTGLDQFLYRATDAGGAFADGAVTLTVPDADGVLVAVRDDPALPGKKSLFIAGTAGADSIVVRPQGASKTAYTVTVNDGPAEAVAGVTGRIYVTAGDGNDAIRLGGVRIPAVIDAGAGNDTVTTGAGTDTLTGGAGNDVLDAGAGRDRLVETANASMTLVSGTTTRNGGLTGIGTDTLVRNRIEEAELTAGPGGDVIDAAAFAGRTTLAGGDGVDVLRASRGGSLLNGGNGADQLVGGAGRDILLGGDGADVLTGGGGQDILIGGLGGRRADRAGRRGLANRRADRLRRQPRRPGRDPGRVDVPGHLRGTGEAADRRADGRAEHGRTI